MDLITKLLKSREPITGVTCNAILNIVYKSTQYTYFILYIEEGNNTKQLIYITLRYILS